MNGQGNTPLDIAKHHGYSALCVLLESQGGRTNRPVNPDTKPTRRKRKSEKDRERDREKKDRGQKDEGRREKRDRRDRTPEPKVCFWLASGVCISRVHAGAHASVRLRVRFAARTYAQRPYLLRDGKWRLPHLHVRLTPTVVLLLKATMVVADSILSLFHDFLLSHLFAEPVHRRRGPV